MFHFVAMPDQKTIGTRCLVLICECQNVYPLSKKKKRILAQKRPILFQSMQFWTKRTIRTRWFSDMWVPELCSLPKKLGCLAQKRPQNMLSWAHIGLAGSFGAPLVGGCGARTVSRKAPIYF